ncbi:hypothetical protein bcCo53_000612 [Borrelia coriaceae]|uniref:Uncharacterized protein n=1 Tax=Borrelia coriaceae ATCC 43381 TaxID=1408429 RepID=W5T0H4_9SPIR|nr:hypothetical protein [Borrelia coriaceae]AHH10796.1 Hypothetical protein BCO_0053800 [Borrelia coriaceae ATCC 43381]UPA16461.1 hypothetical protein bcCo53_000612 [Borrelia coriaceae]
MKDGVRKPSGNRVAFNLPSYTKNKTNNNFWPFINSDFGKNFTKKKKKSK